MTKYNLLLRTAVILFTLASAVFMFFDWFTLSIPMLDSLLESSDYSISFMTLPALVEDSALGIITTLGGKSTSIMVLILCAVLKYLCVLSAGLALCGIFKCGILARKTRLIFSSQIIALGMQLLAFIIMIMLNVFLKTYSGALASSMNMSEDMFDFQFIPTMWLIFAVVCSVWSLVTSTMYNKALGE